MNEDEHDPRCEGGEGSEQKLLDDVAKYGWHVMNVLDDAESPGWSYSIGLYHTFGHAEILVFGLDFELMHSMINSIGEDIRSGKRFEVDQQYADLIESYSCTFKRVNPVWYEAFLGFATWFYEGEDYPVLQCFWPDFEAHFPWEASFNKDLSYAQPLLFHRDRTTAQTSDLSRSPDLDASN